MEDSDDEEYVDSSRKTKNRAPKPVVPTWADAAKKVLERYDHAVPHKKILQIIQDEKLKPCGRGTMPLACLNAMLNSNCKGKDALFYRAPGQAACFGLKNKQRKEKSDGDDESNASSETQGQADSPAPEEATASDSASSTSSKTRDPCKSTGLRSAKSKPSVQRPISKPMTMAGSPGAALVAMPPRKPGAALCVMPPKKRPKLNADQDDDSKDSVRLSKADAALSTSPCAASSAWTSERDDSDSNQASEQSKEERELKLQQQIQRLKRHKQQQQQLAERSRQQQLRMSQDNRRGFPFGSKPSLPKEQKDIEEILRQIKNEQQEQLQKESLRNQRKVMQAKLNRNRQISRSKATTQTSTTTTAASAATATTVSEPPPKVARKPPPVTGFLEVKLKRLKKMSMVDQIKRTKEGKVDLQSPESVFATISLKSLLNNAMFKALPPAYQYQLLMLLPDVDRVKDKDNIVRMIPNALTNEFFTKACLEWQEKLFEGEFNVDIIQRIKQEEGKSITLDPWKEKYFEPAWGKSSIPNPIANEEDKKDSGSSTEAIRKERENSWSTFLKFSENTATDHTTEFEKMQQVLRQKAESEAVRRSLQRKQQLLKSPTAAKPKIENIAKDRSKRAIKRAQLYQKKIHLEKQLTEVNTKLNDKTRPPSPNTQQRLLATRRDISIALRKIIEHTKETRRHGEMQLRQGDAESPISRVVNASGTPELGRPMTEEEIRRYEKRKLKKRKHDRRSDENIRRTEFGPEELTFVNKDGVRVNFFDERRLHSRKHKKEKHKKKKHRDSDGSGKSRHSSKIVKGASVYVRKTLVPCPCKLAPMTICNGCGAFCHSDCINSDKMCTLCVP